MAFGSSPDWIDQINRGLLSAEKYSPEWYFWKGAELFSLKPERFPPMWPSVCLTLIKQTAEKERVRKACEEWEISQISHLEWDHPK